MKITLPNSFLPKKVYLLLLAFFVAVMTACGGDDDEPESPTGGGNDDDEQYEDEYFTEAISPSILSGDWVLESVITDDGEIKFNVPFTILPFEIKHTSQIGGYEIEGNQYWCETYYDLVVGSRDDTSNPKQLLMAWFIKPVSAPLSKAKINNITFSIEHLRNTGKMYTVAMLELTFDNNTIKCKSGSVTESYFDNNNTFQIHPYDGEVKLKKQK